MIFFGMNNVNDKSTKNGFDDRIKDQIKSVKQRYLAWRNQMVQLHIYH